jgi:hypothetical protein
MQNAFLSFIHAAFGDDHETLAQIQLDFSLLLNSAALQPRGDELAGDASRKAL